MRTPPNCYLITIYNYHYMIVKTLEEAKKICTELDNDEESECADYIPAIFGEKL